MQPEIRELLPEYVRGRLDAASAAQVEQAMHIAKPGGTVVLVGIPAEDRTSFTASVARRKGLTIKLDRRMAHTYPRCIALAAAGKVDLEMLATHRFPLERLPEAFDLAIRRADGVLKTIIEP